MKCGEYFHIALLSGLLVSKPALATCPNPAEPGGQSVEGASGWQCSSGSGGDGVPTGCPNVGDQCDDDSYYVGELGGEKIYATSSDSEVSRSWNNGTENWSPTGFASTTNGPGNTDGLVNLSDSGAPYEAAEYCDDLTAHGHSDLYLPAKDELHLFYNSGSPVAGVQTGGSNWYWASTENNTWYSWCEHLGDGNQVDTLKTDILLVRCVRRIE